VQFGHPIAAFEITQRKVASLATEIYAADAMLGILASFADQPDRDLSLAAACCKVFASELLWRAADEMVQVAGGRGFVKPYPYERLLRDARINRIFEGTNEILRLFIALNGVQGPAERLKSRRRASGTDTESRLDRWLRGDARAQRRRRSASLDVELDDSPANDKRYLGSTSPSSERRPSGWWSPPPEDRGAADGARAAGGDGDGFFATAATIARTQRRSKSAAHRNASERSGCELFCVDAGTLASIACCRFVKTKPEDVAAAVARRFISFRSDSDR
jgi:hypothetical protein